MKKFIIIFIIIIHFTSCNNNRSEQLKITESDKINLLELEDFYELSEIKKMINVKVVEYSKTRDFEDNCIVYHYSNDFFSEKNKFRGALTSDTYEYFDKEKNDIKRFFNDSLNKNRKFENFDFILTDKFKLDSKLYSIHKLMDGNRLSGYEIAIINSNKIIRSSLIFAKGNDELNTEKLNKKINKIKTLDNTSSTKSK